MRQTLSTGPGRALCGLVICSVLIACEPAAQSSAPGDLDAAVAGGSATPPPTSPPAPTMSDPAASVTTPEGLDGAALHEVAPVDGGMAAVGSDEDGAAAWTSHDGVTWEPVRVQDGADTHVLRAVAFSDRGVAFGEGDGAASRLWTSGDGGRWRAGGAQPPVAGRINAVAVDGHRWIAVGDVADGESGEAYAGAVWASGDGRSWESVTELPLHEGTISDVAVVGDTVVVVGFDVRGARAWVMRGDGPVEDADGEGFAGATIAGVAAVRDGFVALGRDVVDLRPIAWTSSDGRAWAREDLDADVFAPDEQINDLATVAERVVAVGGSPDGGAVWTSPDGRSWVRGS